METVFVALALASAALHASWNTFVKAASDRLVVLATVSLGYAVAGAVMIPFFGVPARPSWVYAIITTLFYYVYLWLLHRIYLHGDVSYTYPLSRGAAPMLVAVGAALLGGEWLTPLAALGLVLACLGIMSLAVFGTTTPQCDPLVLLLSFTSSVVIAAMMVSNGMGARASGAPMAFIAWVLFMQAPVIALAVVLRRRQLWLAVRAEPIKAVGAGASATLAYVLSIYASAYAPMGGVAALRETSVIMAALLGATILGERPWRPRVLAACVVAAGAALVAVNGAN